MMLFQYLLVGFVVNMCWGRCVPFPDNATHLTCSQFVEYEYYSNDENTSATDLAASLIAQLPRHVDLFPQRCRTALVALMCADTFRRCDSELSANYSHSDGLPFERPCLSLCSAARSECTGLPQLLGFELDCDRRYEVWEGSNATAAPSPLPHRYSRGDNGTACVNATALSDSSQSLPSVTSAVSVYGEDGSSGFACDGAGVVAPDHPSRLICRGFVGDVFLPSSDMYAPAAIEGLGPGSALSSSCVSQALLDLEVHRRLSVNVPRYAGEVCYNAARRYWCNTVFLQPQPHSIEALLSAEGVNGSHFLHVPAQSGHGNVTVNASVLFQHNSSFSLPAYPLVDACVGYSEQCAGIIEAALLPGHRAPNCSATWQSYLLNPTGNVCALNVAFGVSTCSNCAGEAVGVQLVVKTAPNPAPVDNSSVSAYSATCPDGFVVPPEPDGRFVYEYESGSDCVQMCKNPYWTDDEYERIDLLMRTMSLVCCPVMTILLIKWRNDKRKKLQYLGIAFVGIGLLLCFTMGVMSFIPFQQRFCKDVATPITGLDGVNPCNVEAMIFVFTYISAALCWLFQCIEAMRKVVWGWKKPESYFPIGYGVCIFFVPIVYGGYMMAMGKVGYTKGNVSCTVLSSAGKSSYDNEVATFIGLPIVVMLALGLICMVAVIIKMIFLVFLQSNNRVTGKRLKIFWAPVLFVGIYFMMWIFFVIVRVTGDHEAYTQGFKDWAVCIFTHFESLGSDKEARLVCGEHTKERPPFPLILTNIFFLAGQGTIITLVYSGDLFAEWRKRLGVDVVWNRMFARNPQKYETPISSGGSTSLAAELMNVGGKNARGGIRALERFRRAQSSLEVSDDELHQCPESIPEEVEDELSYSTEAAASGKMLKPTALSPTSRVASAVVKEQSAAFGEDEDPTVVGGANLSTYTTFEELNGRSNSRVENISSNNPVQMKPGKRSTTSVRSAKVVPVPSTSHARDHEGVVITDMEIL